MKYEDFLKEAGENLIRFLPEAYSELDVIIESTKEDNHNDSKKLVLKRIDGDKVISVRIPGAYLDSYYEEIQQGKNMESVWECMAASILDILEGDISVENILILASSYELLKENLSVRIINAEKNQDLLKDVLYEMHDGLACVYGFAIEGSSTTGWCNIGRSILEYMGVDEEKLRQDAWDSMRINDPVRFMPLQMDGVIEALESEPRKVLEEIEDIDPCEDIYMLTSQNMYNGAAYVCDNKVLGRIANWLEADLIILPSSIHEVMIIPERVPVNSAALAELSEMIRDINEQEVAAEDRLSDSVYLFRRNVGELRKYREEENKE